MTSVIEEQHTIAATDGFPLSATLFRPEEPRAWIVVGSAMAIGRRFYGKFARWFAERGYAVLTYDYRGSGGSRPPSERRAMAATRMRDWGERDLEGVLRWVRERADGRPRVLVGHSFGGQAMALAEGAAELDAAVFISAQSGWIGHWPEKSFARLRLAVMWWVMVPLVTSLLPEVPRWAGLGDVVPSGAVREWARWCRSPGYLFDHVDGARARMRAFTGPLLALSFTDDDYAPAAAVDSLVKQSGASPVDRRDLAPSDLGLRSIGHFGPFRPSAEPLWQRIAEWLDKALEKPSPQADTGS